MQNRSGFKGEEVRGQRLHLELYRSKMINDKNVTILLE